MREAEFQRLKCKTETRERALENLDAEPGDAVKLDGDETWLFLEVERRGEGPMVALESWDEMKTVSPSRVEAK